jgi:hypothetical protein
MASPGTQRIWYQPVSFDTGLTVTAKLYTDGNVLVNGDITFQEMVTETGIYFADINFPSTGKYILVFSEDGTRTIMFVTEVGTGAGFVTYARAG